MEYISFNWAARKMDYVFVLHYLFIFLAFYLFSQFKDKAKDEISLSGKVLK
jgi:hypothetical protein